MAHQGSELRVQSTGYYTENRGPGLRVQGVRFRVYGLGFRIQGSGFMVLGYSLGLVD